MDSEDGHAKTQTHPFYRSNSKRSGLPVACSDVSHGAWSPRLFLCQHLLYFVRLYFLCWLVFCPVSLSGLSPEPHCLTHCSLGTIMPLARTSRPVSSSSMMFTLRATSPCRVQLFFFLFLVFGFWFLMDVYSTACHIILTKTRFRLWRVVGYTVSWCRCEHADHADQLIPSITKKGSSKKLAAYTVVSS